MILNQIKSWNLLPALILILTITGIILPAQAADHTTETTGLTHVDSFFLTTSTKIVEAAKNHPRATAAIGIVGLLAVCYAGYRYYKKATATVPVANSTPVAKKSAAYVATSTQAVSPKSTVIATERPRSAEEQQVLDLELIQVSKDNIIDRARALFTLRANINAQDRYGTTPLMAAATWGHKEIVQLLLEAGADITKENEQGTTALKLAKIHKNTEIIELLEQAALVKKSRPRRPGSTPSRIS